MGRVRSAVGRSNRPFDEARPVMRVASSHPPTLNVLNEIQADVSVNVFVWPQGSETKRRNAKRCVLT